MRTDIKLFCWIHGDGPKRIFPVVVSASDTIGDLKIAVRSEIPEEQSEGIVAKSLRLWKVNNIPRKSFNVDAIRDSDLQDDQELGGGDNIVDIWENGVDSNLLHVVVCIPVAPGKRKRPEPMDIASTVVNNWISPASPLPPLENLSAYITADLEDGWKVPISQHEMRKLLASGSNNPRDMCTEQDALSLFTVTDDEKAESIWDILWTAIRKSPPDDNTSENGFISFWDDNIRYIIMIAIVGTVIRDSNRNMSTGLQRPDFGLLMGGICTFRGEEKPTVYDGRHPRDELVEKLTYTYSPAPYIIGYYAIGPQMTVVAISPGLGKPLDLVTVDLSLRSQRIFSIVHMIKLLSIITKLREIIGTRSYSEFVPLFREDTGAVITVGSSAVEKKYTRNDQAARVSHLVKIYALLEEKNVPNVDHLQMYRHDSSHGYAVYLQPKGLPDVPRSRKEVIEALICVLEALVCIHTPPQPLFHRDIRWPNIIRNAGIGTKWFLIDWDDASTTPTAAALHLDHRTHSPDVFRSGHGGEVDIWSVGKLIIDSIVFTRDISDEMKVLGEKMMTGEINNATQAHNAVVNL